MGRFVNELDKEITRLQKYKEREMKIADDMIARSKGQLAIATALDNMVTEISFTVSCWVDGVSIFTHPKAFLSFEDPDFLDLLEKVEDITGQPFDSTDNPNNDYRLYQSGSVKVFATPKDESLCRRILVGTKPVETEKYVKVIEEKPIYEYKC